MSEQERYVAASRQSDEEQTTSLVIGVSNKTTLTASLQANLQHPTSQGNSRLLSKRGSEECFLREWLVHHHALPLHSATDAMCDPSNSTFHSWRETKMLPEKMLNVHCVHHDARLGVPKQPGNGQMNLPIDGNYDKLAQTFFTMPVVRLEADLNSSEAD